MSFFQKGCEPFDYTYLFNALSAQDAKAVMRALRPVMSRYERLLVNNLSHADNARRDQNLIRAAEFEGLITDILDTLDNTIRGSVANYILQSFNISHDLGRSVRQSMRGVSTGIELVRSKNFNKALAALQAVDDLDLRLPELEETLLECADHVLPGQRFDAFMMIAYTIQNAAFVERALERALETMEYIPVPRRAPDLDARDTAYFAASEVYGVAKTGTAFEQAVKAQLTGYQAARSACQSQRTLDLRALQLEFRDLQSGPMYLYG